MIRFFPKEERKDRSPQENKENGSKIIPLNEEVQDSQKSEKEEEESKKKTNIKKEEKGFNPMNLKRNRNDSQN